MKRIYGFINIFCFVFFFSFFMEQSVLAVDIQLPKYFTIPVNEILDLTSYEHELNINKGKTKEFHNSLTWDMRDKISDTEFRSDVPGWYKGCVKESLSTDEQVQCLPIVVTDEAHQIVSVDNKDIYIEGSLSQIPSGLSLEAVTDYVNDSIKFYEIDMLNDGNIQQDAVSSDRVNVILEDDDTVSVLIDNSRVLQSEFNQEVQSAEVKAGFNVDDLKPGRSWQKVSVNDVLDTKDKALQTVINPLTPDQGQFMQIYRIGGYDLKYLQTEKTMTTVSIGGGNERELQESLVSHNFILPFYSLRRVNGRDILGLNVVHGDTTGGFLLFIQENGLLDMYDLTNSAYWLNNNSDVLVWTEYSNSLKQLTGLSIYKPFFIKSKNYQFGYQVIVQYNENTGFYDIYDHIYNLNDKDLELGLMSTQRQNHSYFDKSLTLLDSNFGGYRGYKRGFSGANTYIQFFEPDEAIGWNYYSAYGRTDENDYNQYKSEGGGKSAFKKLQRGAAFSGEVRPSISTNTSNFERPIVVYGSELSYVSPNQFIELGTHVYLGAYNTFLQLSSSPKKIAIYDTDSKNQNVTLSTSGGPSTSEPQLYRKDGLSDNYEKTSFKGREISYPLDVNDYPLALATPGISSKEYTFQTRIESNYVTYPSNELRFPIDVYTFGADVLGSFQTTNSSASITVDQVKPLLKPYYISDRGTLTYQWVEASQNTCSTESSYLTPSSPTTLKLNNVAIDNTYYGCLEMKQEASKKQYYISFPINVIKVISNEPRLLFVNKSIQIREDWQDFGTSVQDKLILEASQPYILLSDNTIEASYPSKNPSRFSVKNRSENEATICYKKDNNSKELCDSIIINNTEQKIMWNGMQGSYDSKDNILTLNSGVINFNFKNEAELAHFWENQAIEVIIDGDDEVIDEEEISKYDIKKVIFDSEIPMQSTQDMIYLLGMFARESLDGTSYCSEESTKDKYFCNLKEIEGLDKLRSDSPVNIAGMFTGNTSIDKMDLSKFQPKIQSSDQYGAFEGTFKNMSGLKEVTIPMSNADKESLKNTFSGDHRLEKIVIRSNNNKDMQIDFTPSGLISQQRTATDFRKNSGWINNSLQKAYTKGIGEVALLSKNSLEFIWQPQGNNITVDVKDFDGIYDQTNSFTNIGQYDYKQINIPDSRKITKIKRGDQIMNLGKEGELIYQAGNDLYIKSNELYANSNNIQYTVELQADKPIELSISVPETMSFGINKVGTKEDRPISSPDPWKLKVRTNIPSNQWKIKIIQTKDLAKSKSQVICEGTRPCFVYRDKSGVNHDLSKGKSVILNSSEFELDQKNKLDWTTEWGKKTKHNYGLFFNTRNIPSDIKLGTYKTEFLFSMETSI